MKNDITKNDEFFNIDDLKNAQKLTYSERLKILEEINEFIMIAMPEENKQISLKLQENGF